MVLEVLAIAVNGSEVVATVVVEGIEVVVSVVVVDSEVVVDCLEVNGVVKGLEVCECVLLLVVPGVIESI